MLEDRSTSHSYGIAAVLRGCFVSLGIFPLTAIGLLIAKQARSAASDQVASSIAIVALIGVFVFFLLAWLALWQMYPEIQTSSRGIKIRFFWFWWLYVPWDSVVDVFRWRLAGKRTLIVVVDRLTRFHRLYGIVYAEVAKPAFLISGSIERYDELVQIIKLHTGEDLAP